MAASLLGMMTAVGLPAGGAVGDTLTFNATWGFDSPSNRSARANALDLELRRRGGFYDSFQTTINYEGNTFITYDCTGSNARSAGNESLNSSEARTSSPNTGSEVEIESSARGNQVESHGIDDGSLANEQTNTGEVESNVASNVTNTTGPLNAGGGVTTQTTRTEQSNSGTVRASATGGVGCNFYGRDEHAGRRSIP